MFENTLACRLPALKTACAIGIMTVMLGVSAGADDALTLEDGVEPHAGIDALYHRLSETVGSLDSSGFALVYAD